MPLKFKKKRRHSKLLLMLQLVISVIFVMLVLYVDIFPNAYLGVLVGILAVQFLVNYLLLRWDWGRIVSYLLSVIIFLILIAGGYYVYKTSDMLNKITSVNTEINNINVYVRADDPAESIEDAVLYDFGILGYLDMEHTDATIDKINEELDSDISTRSYEVLTDLIDNLLRGDIDAVILDEVYISFFEDIEGYENLEGEIKSIYINSFETDMEEEEVAVNDVSSEGFVLYISGIDTEGSVLTKSRSDVNILMIINPVTRKILLVNTPRDYYVPLSISNGVRDKLTHAGNYGINTSIDTLEMLYDINIDFYLRINFTSFVTIVDTLGGVSVNSDYSFSASGYSFAEGDRQRGNNQMAVIQAIINKLNSSAVLNNYTALLNNISSSIQTNISDDAVSDLVKMQLSDMRSWEISTFSVDGTGTSEYTYSMPGQKSYVMVPDESTVNEAKEKINEILD